jgi:putative hydrolase of the HAD superfamily
VFSVIVFRERNPIPIASARQQQATVRVTLRFSYLPQPATISRMNVVFDLGGVVVTWEPERLIAHHFPDSREADLIRTGLFQHQDWVQMDRGTLTVGEASRRAAARTGLAASRIERILYAIPPSLELMDGTVRLIRELRALGHKVLALSNMPYPSIEHLERQEAFRELFDAAVISCRINLVKPDAAIFTHLLSTQLLVPEETLFFDDTRANVEGARACGIHAEVFTTAAACRSHLKQAGCLEGTAV